MNEIIYKDPVSFDKNCSLLLTVKGLAIFNSTK